MLCPNCGVEVSEGYKFCGNCGYRLISEPETSRKGMDEASIKEEVRNVLIRRIDGIKDRDAKAIASLVNVERYTKFDDWPPFWSSGSRSPKERI